MGDFSEFGIEIEKQLSKLGRDIQHFVEKVVPIASEEKDFAPDCDIVESEGEYKILLDLPGLAKREIEISLKENVLTIKGKREFILAEGEEIKREERKSGAFARSFAVPQNVNTAEVKASFKNGVLTIAMPKTNAMDDSQSIPVN